MDALTGIAVDAAGYIHVAGWTESSDLRTVNAAQSRTGGGVDAFLAKLTPDGGTIVYWTYFGGTGDDRALSIAVDVAGNAYVTGSTTSVNFPRAGVWSGLKSAGRDVFVAKLNSAGALVYSLCIGGSDQESGNGIAVDASGAVYITGETACRNFPVVSAAQTASAGLQDAFLFKINPGGSAIAFSTYIGGYLNDSGKAVAVDAAGNAYVTGYTESMDFPDRTGFAVRLPIRKLLS